MLKPTRCATICRLMFSSVGAAVGILAAVLFSVVFKNYNASLWALISGIIAALNLGLHVLYCRQGLSKRAYNLPHLMLFGCFGQLAGVCGFAVYLTLAFVKHQGVTAYGNAYYVTSVWTFMTWKWSFLTFYQARLYKRLLDYFSIHPDEAHAVNEADPII